MCAGTPVGHTCRTTRVALHVSQQIFPGFACIAVVSRYSPRTSSCLSKGVAVRGGWQPHLRVSRYTVRAGWVGASSFWFQMVSSERCFSDSLPWLAAEEHGYDSAQGPEQVTCESFMQCRKIPPLPSREISTKPGAESKDVWPSALSS